MFNARVAPQPGAVALHLFGTPLGTCPPGSALSAPGRSGGSSGGAAAASAAAGASARSGGDDGSPFALSANGTVIDLSSAFQPECAAAPAAGGQTPG